MITINNDNLLDIILFRLDKLENQFTQEELDQIREIVIDFDMEDSPIFSVLKEALKLRKLESLTIRNANFLNDDFSYLLQFLLLKEIVFENCEFENADLIASLKVTSISFIHCRIVDYTFVNLFSQLKELTIIDGSVEMHKINSLNLLSYLQLSYSNIKDTEELSISSIKELFIDHTNIHSIDFVKKLPNLERLSIDEVQYNNNRSIVEYLINNHIRVFEDNMIEIGGDHE